MPRRYDKSDKGVLITRESIGRLARVINGHNASRRDVHSPKLRTAFDEGGGELRVAKTTAAWSKGTTQEVQLVYEGDCETEGDGEETQLAYNLAFNVGNNVLVWIAEAANGCWYMVSAASCPTDASCACPAIGGQDLTTIGNYNSSATQILAHQNGCLTWLDTDACPEPPTT
jgi:hypothetical protein